MNDHGAIAFTHRLAGPAMGDGVAVAVPEIARVVPGDLSGDDVVNGADLAILLGAWSLPPGSPGCSGAAPCPADLSHDGLVNAADLAILLGRWTN